jgi:hypothetical protein
MTLWRNFAWVVVLAAAAAGSCYRPKITDGGLHCAEGRLCPDGFHCSADGTCKQGPPPKCQASSPHLEPLCTPPAGDDCDPVCQSRCDCGRCALVGTALQCLAPGTKKRGEFCNRDADDCEPGNVCFLDCDGPVARCARICGKGDVMKDDVCGGGQLCNVAVMAASGAATDLWVCPAPPQPCNPVGDTVDCGDSNLGCYFDDTVNSTVCDCKGKGQPNGTCSVFNSCVPGYRCVTLSAMGPVPHCLKTCAAGTDCPSGSCTAVGGTGFGFCQP